MKGYKGRKVDPKPLNLNDSDNFFLPLQPLRFLLPFDFGMKFRIQSIAVFLLLFVPLTLFGQSTDRIARIEIIGNERIDRGVISNAIKTKVNDPFDLDKLREDLKNIYKTGFFNDVQIDVQDSDRGKLVTFVVVERPPIKSIFIAGNKKIKTEEIRGKLKIQTNSVLNIEKIKETIDEIKKFYVSKAYYNVRITYEIDYGDGYDVAVKFFIEEPPMAFVRKVTFTGNKVFPASKLKNYMRTKERGLFSWITGSGVLDEEALDDDRKNIESFYNDNGYVKASVGVPDITVSKDGKSISISLPVEEGKIYKIGKVEFSGDILFSSEDMLKKLKSKSGNTFRSTLYQDDVFSLTDYYQDQGYAFAEIQPMTLIDDERLEVDMRFNIVKGEEIYINRINILGNIRTRDKVIRRELRFAEGDRFSGSKLKESQRRLKNTTYFQNLDMKIAKTDDPKKVNMDVTIEEKPTGSLSAGVGYSTDEKVMVSGSISQENFFGTGRKVFLDASLGSVTQQFRFTFVEPYLLDMNLGLATSIYNYERAQDEYDYKKRGFSFTFTRPLTDFVNATFGYRYESTRVFNIDPFATEYIKDQFGTKLTSAISLGLSKNTINDVMNPTKGINWKGSVDWAGGPLRGDNYFVRLVTSYGQFFPWKFLDSTFFIRGTAGTIQTYGGKQLPIYEKFFVGGIDSVRGFKYGYAGPLDIEGEPIGGKNQLFFNGEWIFPIFKPAGIKGVLFYDIGAASDNNDVFAFTGLRHAAGAGIRWQSPMGPIRIEFGFNLFPKKGERTSVFDFTMGTQY